MGCLVQWALSPELATMYISFMAQHVSRLTEVSATNVTCIWFGSRMRAAMFGDCRAIRE